MSRLDRVMTLLTGVFLAGVTAVLTYAGEYLEALGAASGILLLAWVWGRRVDTNGDDAA